MFSIRIDLPPEAESGVDFGSLPSGPGVYALEDESGGTIALATTANLRRTVSAKLRAPDPDAGRSRQVDFSSVARRVLAVPVQSAFEADWAYLQNARIRLPRTYRAALDRWQAWFVHCDPDAEFPQFTKTVHPGRLPSPGGVCLGPFRDKHAAARYMDVLQDTFDLCRYHHILVQSPHGKACAYKEMGRCPAPCDGTVPMEHYHGQIARAIEFACTPIAEWREALEERMKQASLDLDFEQARRCRDQIDRAAPAAKPEFAFVDRIERFIFLALMRRRDGSGVCMMFVRGGWIEPLGDLAFDAPESAVVDLLDRAGSKLEHQPVDLGAVGCENIGLVCWHLFHPKRTARGEFVRCSEKIDSGKLLATIRRLGSKPASSDEDVRVDEQTMETPDQA